MLLILFMGHYVMPGILLHYNNYFLELYILW